MQENPLLLTSAGAYYRYRLCSSTAVKGSSRRAPLCSPSRIGIAGLVQSVVHTAYPYLIHTPQGKICIAMVAYGNANDSPYPRMMIRMLPDGSGDLLGDAAYGGIKNCNAVRESGRRPVIDPKSNAVPNEHNARADMIRFRDEHPRTFYSILCIRNSVESVFASIKDRFGSIV